MKNKLLLLFTGAIFLIGNVVPTYAVTMSAVLFNPQSPENPYSIVISSGSQMVTTGTEKVYLAGNWTNKGGTFAPATGTVVLYDTAAQTVGGSAATTFNNLTLSGSHAKNISTSTVNGVLSLEGTASISGSAPTYGSAATLQYKGSVAQTTSTELPSTFNGSGGIIINNFSGVTLGNSLAIPNGGLNIMNGALKVNPQINLTVGGSTTLNSQQCLIIKSTASGPGSVIDNGFVGGGNAQVEKFIAANTYGKSVAAPVNNAGVSVFTGSDGAKYFDPLTTNWIDFTSGNMTVMKGYFTRFTGTAGTLLFDYGNLNSGWKTYFDLWRTGTGLTSNHGWNLVGNPYPSAINWDEIVTLNGGSSNFVSYTRLNNAINVSDGNGGYNSYINGVGTPNDLVRIIPSATAFWVQVNSAYTNPGAPIAGASLAFSNSARVHQNTVTSKAASDLKIIRLSIANSNFTDGLVVRLEDAATNLFDPEFDAYKMLADNVAYPQIYSITTANDFLSINTISSDLSQPVSVPLGITDASNNLLTITASDFSNIDANVGIYLEDKLLNQMINLRIQPSYSFNTSLSEDNNRFILHFGQVPYAINSPDNSDNSTIYTYGKDIFISQIEEPTVCTIYNMLGQEVERTDLTVSSLQKVHASLSTGTYIVSLTGAKKVIKQKVIIKE